jgi:hypothetical protein
MNQRTASLAVLVVAATAVVGVPAAGFDPGAIAGDRDAVNDVTDREANGPNATAAENGTANETSPGVRLTGIVGVQKAEIDGELRSRGFEISLNRSSNNDSKAAVIADQVTDLESGLEELRDRKDELDRARENDTITEGEYRARIAEVAARISTVRRLVNQTSSASQGIPAETLEERGLNTSEIRKLGDDARNLSGPEVAAIARGIAGPGVGKGLGQGPPGNKTNPGKGDGPPGNGDGPPGNGDDPPGNGDGPPGAGEPGPPGSNDSDNESDAPENGPPGIDNAPGDAVNEPEINDAPGDAVNEPVIEIPGDEATDAENRTRTDDAAPDSETGAGVPDGGSSVGDGVGDSDPTAVIGVEGRGEGTGDAHGG